MKRKEKGNGAKKYILTRLFTLHRGDSLYGTIGGLERIKANIGRTRGGKDLLPRRV
jgi:hypothetical protein